MTIQPPTVDPVTKIGSSPLTFLFQPLQTTCLYVLPSQTKCTCVIAPRLTPGGCILRAQWLRPRIVLAHCSWRLSSLLAAVGVYCLCFSLSFRVTRLGVSHTLLFLWPALSCPPFASSLRGGSCRSGCNPSGPRQWGLPHSIVRGRGLDRSLRRLRLNLFEFEGTHL